MLEQLTRQAVGLGVTQRKKCSSLPCSHSDFCLALITVNIKHNSIVRSNVKTETCIRLYIKKITQLKMTKQNKEAGLKLLFEFPIGISVV